MCILLCYIFNKYEIENRRYDYRLYQFIGMTQKDILKKQICKGYCVFCMIVILDSVWLIIQCLYLDYWYLPIGLFVCLLGIMFVICISVYTLPLHNVLTNSPLDGIHKTE